MLHEWRKQLLSHSDRIHHETYVRSKTMQLSDHQSGFRKKDGTSFQLLQLVQQWSEAVDDGYYVGVIFFDLKKAFDKVWHDGLLAK